MDLTIATAKSKNSKMWSNKVTTWDDLIKDFSTPKVVDCPTKTYHTLEKVKKDKLKDVGGYVGGELFEDGRRISANIKNRYLLTLDVDFPVINNKTFLTRINFFFDYEAIVHATLSHTNKNPRMRIIIPLKYQVAPQEYVELAKMVAKEIGEEFFDATTFEPQRLMYFPAKLKDNADYFFTHHKTGEFLDPSRYLNISIPDTLTKKAQDPTIKTSIVGAYCRVYDIHEVIKNHLSEIYIPTEDENRYSYAKGTSYGGLIIYDDGKFAYCHHESDQISGKLVNAFDLLRLHKFGYLDKKASKDTPTTHLPSYKKMEAFALKDKKVQKEYELIKEEQLAKKTNLVSTEWLKDLDKTKDGKIIASSKNIETILTNDENLKGMVAYDTFANKIILQGNPPWRDKEISEYWSNSDDSALRVYLDKTYGIYSRQKVEDAFNSLLQKNTFHPVKDYLDLLIWDGQKRVEKLLVTYLGAKDESYTHLVTKKFLVAAVARIYRPGIKFDEMLVTIGPQGIGKTLLARKLAKSWFSNTLYDMHTRDAADALKGVWIMEIGELTATRKSDMENVKNFLSKQEDIYRAAYAKKTEIHKRQCVFWGTTNDHQFLKDSTGSRRFWPVEVGIKTPKVRIWNITDDEVNQIWAEAKYYFDNNFEFTLSEKEKKEVKNHQELHTDISPLVGMIKEYLEIPITKDWYKKPIYERRNYISNYSNNFLGDESTQKEGHTNLPRKKVSVIEIWYELLGGDIKNLPPVKATEIRGILENLEGWGRSDTNKGQSRFGKEYGKQIAYINTKKAATWIRGSHQCSHLLTLIK